MARASGMRRTGRRTGEQLIEFVVGEVFVFIKQAFPFPRLINSATGGLKEREKLSGEAPSPGFRSCFLEILQKVSPACQDESTHGRGLCSKQEFRERESPIRVPQKQLAFDPHAQRKSKVNCNAHRRARSRRHKYDGPDQFDYQERPRIREKWRGDKDTLYGS